MAVNVKSVHLQHTQRKMDDSRELKNMKIRQALIKIPFDVLALVTVLLPAVSLAVCFVYSMIFQFENVNFTMCDVSALFMGKIFFNGQFTNVHILT